MATIANQYDPNNPNASQNTGGGGTVMPSTGGGAASGGAGGGAAPSSSSTPYQPPNVSQYLAANQGAGQKLTQGITGNLQNQANQLNSATNTAQGNLSSQYNNLNQNLNTNTAQSTANTAFQDPKALLDAYNTAKTQSSSAPLSSDQQNQANQYNQFQQLNTGGYNQGIQNYGSQAQQAQNQLQGQLANLTQQTGSATNEMGRGQLLQNAVGQANYNPGEQNLDTLFLQATPGQGGQSNLQNLQHSLGQIGNQAQQGVSQFGTGNQANLANLQGLSAADQAGIKNLFTTGQWSPSASGGTGPLGLNQISTNIGNQVTAANAAQPGIYNALQTAAGQNKGIGNFNADQLSQLGLSPGQQAWGVGLGQYINQSPAATAATVADQSTMDRYNALNQLAGGPNGLQKDIFGGATQAGGYNPISFDTGAFNTAVQQKQQGLQSDYKTALNQVLQNLNAPIQNASSGSAFAGPNTTVRDTTGFGAFVNQLQNGIQNGSLSPDQANNLITQQQQATLNNMGNFENNDYRNAAVAQINAQYSPFNQFYNNQYQPAESDVLGQSGPNPLPTTPTGAIDWSQIKAPQGK